VTGTKATMPGNESAVEFRRRQQEQEVRKVWSGCRRNIKFQLCEDNAELGSVEVSPNRGETIGNVSTFKFFLFGSRSVYIP
jgi:hypothetical protein